MAPMYQVYALYKTSKGLNWKEVAGGFSLEEAKERAIRYSRTKYKGFSGRCMIKKEEIHSMYVDGKLEK